MPRIEGTTDAQTKFLRSFRSSPSGPGIADWPSPAILRRWLRRPGFVAAMKAMQTTLTYQADFQLLSASAAAAQLLHDAINSSDPSARDTQMKAMRDLLKIAHLRQRFTPPPVKIPPRHKDLLELLEYLKPVHPDVTVGELPGLFRTLMGKGDTEEDDDTEREAA